MTDITANVVIDAFATLHYGLFNKAVANGKIYIGKIDTTW